MAVLEVQVAAEAVLAVLELLTALAPLAEMVVFLFITRRKNDKICNC
jgi:hypothetical protein